jgi:hypothetical protein
MRPHFVRRLTIIFAALTLIIQGGYGRSGDDPKADDEDKKPSSWPPPMSARTARTWITLHETTIRPLPDRTPLRKVMQALREATRGKDGKGREIVFRFKEGALEEAEITLDTPVASPFAGQPEVSVDTYLKYVLYPFVLERYVHGDSVLIDAPCDDCEGYATVSDAEAHAWLLLHQVVPLKFPDETPLGEVIKAMTDATKERGFQGRGLAISAVPWLLRDRPVWSKPVTIVAEDAPIGASLDRVLQPMGLGFRVLFDGNVLILTARKTVKPDDDNELEWFRQDEWDSDFPMFRSTYSAMWHEMVAAHQQGAKVQHDKAREEAAPARP